jgi:UDP-glucose 4-epimerase
LATLVTGGTGFVGSNVVRALAEAGTDVICFGTTPPDSLVRSYVAEWANRISFVGGDVTTRADVLRLADEPIDDIVHAAAFTGVLPEIERARSASIVDVNVVGTTNLLELARHRRVRRFLYVGSSAVYGEAAMGGPLAEDEPARPRSLYAVTKYAAELLVRRYADLFDLDAVTVRLGSPFGPMERVTGHRSNQSLIKEWTGNVLRGEPIEIADRADKVRYLYVSDAARGIIAVLHARTLAFDTYNLGTETEWTAGEVCEGLREIDPDTQVIVRPDAISHDGKLLDCNRLRNDLGWSPTYDLHTGLREYLEWRVANGFLE